VFEPVSKLVRISVQKVHRSSRLCDAESVTARYEPSCPSGRPRAVLESLEGIAAMQSETHAHRYYRQAAECELNASKATNVVDQLAWQSLAEDWTKLALGAAVNPRLDAGVEKPVARQLTKPNSN
jgi:hypothetical protein